jgi:hypothetical protein
VRKVLGPVLLAVGGFLIALAVLAKFYASDAVRVTPLNIDAVQVLTGEAAIGSEPVVPVQATNTTLADSEKSDSDVVVFHNSTCLVKVIGVTPGCVASDDPENRLVSVTEDTFATSRKTGLSVNDSKYLPAGATEHKGLVNKFPFDTKKQTYPYWDALVGNTFDAKYDGTDKVDGVDTYKFKVDITDAPAEVTDGVQGKYSSQRTIWVEPVTGSILKQTEKQQRVANDGSNVIDLSIDMDLPSSKQMADEAKTNLRLLSLVGTWLPIGGLLVGLVTLLGGLALAVGDRRKA